MKCPSFTRSMSQSLKKAGMSILLLALMITSEPPTSDKDLPRADLIMGSPDAHGTASKGLR